MPEVNRRWIYPTVNASENKGIERIALSGEGTAHEVVGVDGSRRFGCRPSSGFRLAHTFDIYKDFSGTAARPFSAVAPPTQAKTSTITDCYPIHFQISEGEFGHGFVYRVKATGTTNSAIYMDFVPTNTVDAATGWRTVLISNHHADAGGHILSTDRMDVVSMGRYVYIFVQGRPVRVFYTQFNDHFQATATFTFGDTEFDDHNSETITIIDGNGLSKTYTIKNDYSADASNLEFNAGASPNVAATNLVNLINGSTGHNGTITAVANPDEGGGALLGKVVLTQEISGAAGDTTISHTSNWDAICDTNPPAAFSGGTPTFTHKIVDGGPGPRPQAGGFGQQSEPANFVTTDGSAGRGTSYVEGSALQGKMVSAAHTSSPTIPANTDFNLFKKGNYTFGYYLHDSLTGRRTALTEIVSINEDNATLPDQTNGNFLGFVLEVDTDLYDQVFMFRSVKQQSVGGTYAGSIMHLDTIYDINDTSIDTEAQLGIRTDQNYPENIKIFQLFYQLDDIALAMQDIYLDKLVCDDEMPFAGSAVPFENTLIVADPRSSSSTDLVTSTDSRVRNIGELRWSSLTERSPELFPINNKYSPDVYQNRVIRLCRAGEFAIGFSRDRLYHIRRNGIFLKIEEMHSGFGLAADNGYATAGPMVYYITRKGLKAVANNGQLDDVKALDNLLLEDWYEDMESLRLSFDPYISCLFVHNPVKEQTVCLWFSTGRVTELHDTCFTDVSSGIFARTYSRNSYDDTTPTPTTSTTMVERSFFLQNHPSTTAGEIPDNWRPRAYLLDVDREKVQVGSNDIAAGQPCIRTLDFPGDSIFTVHSVAQGSGTTTLTLKSGTTGTKTLSHASSLLSDLVGAKAYVLTSTATDTIGTNKHILSHTKGTVNADGSGSMTITTKKSALIEGDVIAISPMLVRYVGGALPMVRSQDGQVITSFDLFQNKQLSSVGCHFTDVSGGVTGYKFFRGLAFNTESDNAAVSAFPRDFSGTIIGDSIKAGESEDYAAFTTTGLTTTGRHGIQDSSLNPAIEVFVPDLDFKMMALICRGRSTNTDTGERNT